VGITRARERLYVTRAVLRSAWGAPQYNPPSRFIEELPEKLVDWARAAPETLTAAPSLAAAADRARRSGRPAGPGGREVPTLSPGDRVSHDSFGLGTVVTVGGRPDDPEVTVDFGSSGVKRLVTRWAPLEKL
jgi:DNA helicase-2/ATP-dependent DNA helicase PcrA